MDSCGKLIVSVTVCSFFSAVCVSPAADGFGESATGGAGGPTVTVSNLTNFKYYATSASPYIIRVSGTGYLR